VPASTDPAALTLAAAGSAIRSGKLRPSAYLEALIAQIGRFEDDLHAFVRPMFDSARAAAAAADAELAAGTWRGPLHGIAVGIKDIIDVAGVPTTCHSAICRDRLAAADATVVARLRAAGAIIIGKLSTHEFAIGGPCVDLPWPPAINPWGPRHSPGGSSSGSGAALAARFVPAALGTDTGGSIRNPAGMCGIVGLKPTYGRVSRAGVFPLSYSLDHVGPMSRTVRDNALLLQVLAGHDPADPGSAAVGVPDFTAGLGHTVAGLRIGVVRHYYTEDLVADPEMAAAIEAAVAELGRQGARIVEVRLPPLADSEAAMRAIMHSEAYSIHERWLKSRPQDYGARTREGLLTGAFIPAGDYILAQRYRTGFVAAVAEAMRDVDVLLTSSAMDPSFSIDDEAAVVRSNTRRTRSAFNVSGNPALVMPAGFSAANLPLAIQIIGKPFDEATVYRVADAYEQATAWHERLPPLLTREPVAA
jgi:aspartyl-tRNA(Asn)/glutamyl-tRNA(Gln) amidotransferase subunit A